MIIMELDAEINFTSPYTVEKTFFKLKNCNMCTYQKQGYFHSTVYTLCVKIKDLKDTQNAQLYEKVALGSRSNPIHSCESMVKFGLASYDYYILVL